MDLDKLPVKMLLRRRDLYAAGINRRQITSAINAGKLTVSRFAGQGRAFFVRTQVEKLIKEMTQ